MYQSNSNFLSIEEIRDYLSKNPPTIEQFKKIQKANIFGDFKKSHKYVIDRAILLSYANLIQFNSKRRIDIEKYILTVYPFSLEYIMTLFSSLEKRDIFNFPLKAVAELLMINEKLDDATKLFISLQ